MTDDADLRALDAGERSAIILALSIHADLVLIDERKGTQAAIDKGLDVTGTLGILQRAARRVTGGGIRSLSRDAHLKRESLYRMLSKSGNPSLDSLSAVLDACGLRLAVQSTAPRRRKRRIA